MKIIHVLSGLAKGGAERVAVELANEAIEKGDQVTILAGWQENPIYLQNKIHPDVNIKFIAKKKSLAYFKIIYWIFTNKKWICSKDVLHCHLTFGAVFGSVANIVLKVILRNKTPIIVETYHAVGMSIPKFNRWLHSRMVLQRNGLVLMAKDPYWDNFILKHPHLKTKIIPNGITVLETTNNSKQKHQLIKEIGISEKHKYLIGTIGMLRPDRKPWLYVPLFYEIYKALGDEAHFVLGGAGEEYNKIKNLVHEQDFLNNFHMLGLVNEPMPIISNMDVYVSVSVGETAGISMIEAAMCKVPVVGIQLIENYKVNKNDWVWSHGDLREVANKIISLLKNPKEREKLANTQKAYVTDNFTSKLMYCSYNSFYKQILDSGNKA